MRHHIYQKWGWPYFVVCCLLLFIVVYCCCYWCLKLIFCSSLFINVVYRCKFLIIVVYCCLFTGDVESKNCTCVMPKLYDCPEVDLSLNPVPDGCPLLNEKLAGTDFSDLTCGGENDTFEPIANSVSKFTIRLITRIVYVRWKDVMIHRYLSWNNTT